MMIEMEFNSVAFGFCLLALMAILAAYALVKERLEGRDDEWVD